MLFVLVFNLKKIIIIKSVFGKQFTNTVQLDSMDMFRITPE